jgi:hypothetical protein
MLAPAADHGVSELRRCWLTTVPAVVVAAVLCGLLIANQSTTGSTPAPTVPAWCTNPASLYDEVGRIEGQIARTHPDGFPGADVRSLQLALQTRCPTTTPEA